MYQLRLNRIDGFIPGRLVFFLMNLHVCPKTIYLAWYSPHKYHTRTHSRCITKNSHGQTEWSRDNRLGGDSPLTERGHAFAQALSTFIQSKESKPLVFCSSKTAALQTVSALPAHSVLVHDWKALDDIDMGLCDGMTWAEIQEKMPSEYLHLSKEPLTHRYPRGESFEDVVVRVEPVVIEMERRRGHLGGILVVAHPSSIR